MIQNCFAVGGIEVDGDGIEGSDDIDDLGDGMEFE